MNETRLWFCDICDKTINIKSKSKHNISKSHKHKDKCGMLVREYEVIRPDIHNVDSVIDNVSKHCHNEYFHIFEYKCIYDIKFTNITKNELLNLIVAGKQMNLYGLRKIENWTRNWFYNYSNKWNDKKNLFDSTKYNYMLLFKILKTNIPSTIFKIISRKPEYVENFCRNLNDRFLFACRRGM